MRDVFEDGVGGQSSPTAGPPMLSHRIGALVSGGNSLGNCVPPCLDWRRQLLPRERFPDAIDYLLAPVVRVEYVRYVREVPAEGEEAVYDRWHVRKGETGSCMDERLVLPQCSESSVYVQSAADVVLNLELTERLARAGRSVLVIDDHPALSLSAGATGTSGGVHQSGCVDERVIVGAVVVPALAHDDGADR